MREVFAKTLNAIKPLILRPIVFAFKFSVNLRLLDRFCQV